jgi:hypothetical protein
MTATATAFPDDDGAHLPGDVAFFIDRPGPVSEVSGGETRQHGDVPRHSHRKVLLQEADRLVNGDRNNQYGPPHQDFQRTADILTGLGFRHGDVGIKAHHVAVILSAVKLSRLMWNPGKADSWIDLAGYAACGHEAYELTKGDK